VLQWLQQAAQVARQQEAYVQGRFDLQARTAIAVTQDVVMVSAYERSWRLMLQQRTPFPQPDSLTTALLIQEFPEQSTFFVGFSSTGSDGRPDIAFRWTKASIQCALTRWLSAANQIKMNLSSKTALKLLLQEHTMAKLATRSIHDEFAAIMNTCSAMTAPPAKFNLLFICTIGLKHWLHASTIRDLSPTCQGTATHFRLTIRRISFIRKYEDKGTRCFRLPISLDKRAPFMLTLGEILHTRLLREAGQAQLRALSYQCADWVSIVWRHMDIGLHPAAANRLRLLRRPPQPLIWQ
jgi:hypothetical protein